MGWKDFWQHLQLIIWILKGFYQDLELIHNFDCQELFWITSYSKAEQSELNFHLKCYTFNLIKFELTVVIIKKLRQWLPCENHIANETIWSSLRTFSSAPSFRALYFSLVNSKTKCELVCHDSAYTTFKDNKRDCQNILYEFFSKNIRRAKHFTSSPNIHIQGFNGIFHYKWSQRNNEHFHYNRDITRGNIKILNVICLFIVFQCTTRRCYNKLPVNIRGIQTFEFLCKTLDEWLLSLNNFLISC